MYLIKYAPSEDSDQPAHAQADLSSLGAYFIAQADLSSLGAYFIMYMRRLFSLRCLTEEDIDQ